MEENQLIRIATYVWYALIEFVIWCDLGNVKPMMIYDLHIKYIIYGPLLRFPQTPPPTTR